MEKKTGYDAVVFDMDGVIFDSERAVMQCWKELADKYQIPDIEKAVLSCTGTTMKRTREIMLEIYGEDFPYDIYAKESSAIYHSRYDGGRLPMKPGVVELLYGDHACSMPDISEKENCAGIFDTQTDRDKPIKGCWNFEFF